METQLEQIRDAQKQSWDHFAPGWGKWDEPMMEFLKPMGLAIIDQLHLQDNATVLDVAAGTGEPGLTIAHLLPKGHVVATDLSEQMLQIARQNADRQGLGNFEVRVADVSELPFADATFDAISCRMGFMFFPDPLLAAKEMARVLKPGGRVATAVWSGPAQNIWVTAIMGAISKHMNLPAPPPNAPGMFRCAAPGYISDLFKSAGFGKITELPITGFAHYETTEIYWRQMNEVAAPVVAAMSKADEATKALIKQDALDTITKASAGDAIALNFGALVVSGEK